MKKKEIFIIILLSVLLTYFYVWWLAETTQWKLPVSSRAYPGLLRPFSFFVLWFPLKILTFYFIFFSTTWYPLKQLVYKLKASKSTLKEEVNISQPSGPYEEIIALESNKKKVLVKVLLALLLWVFAFLIVQKDLNIRELLSFPFTHSFRSLISRQIINKTPPKTPSSVGCRQSYPGEVEVVFSIIGNPLFSEEDAEKTIKSLPMEVDILKKSSDESNSFLFLFEDNEEVAKASVEELNRSLHILSSIQSVSPWRKFGGEKDRMLVINFLEKMQPAKAQKLVREIYPDVKIGKMVGDTFCPLDACISDFNNMTFRLKVKEGNEEMLIKLLEKKPFIDAWKRPGDCPVP